MVADMVVDKVADMVAVMVADMMISLLGLICLALDGHCSLDRRIIDKQMK